MQYCVVLFLRNADLPLVTVFLLRFLIVCVLGIRSTGLPLSWGDACDSIRLTVWVTHDPSTGVRATTSLGGERAQ